MKNDNRGFTLVELIVSLVIFSVVVSAVFGFMLAGSNSYTKTMTRLNMDLDSTLTLNQLSDYIIDCNACIAFENNTLYVINFDEQTIAYTAHVFEYRDGSIFYGLGSADLSDDGSYDVTFTANNLLATEVSAFSVIPVTTDYVHNAYTTVTIGFLRHSTSYTANRTIALRNQPAIGTVSAG